MHIWHCDTDSLSWFCVWVFLCLFVAVWVLWWGFLFGLVLVPLVVSGVLGMCGLFCSFITFSKVRECLVIYKASRGVIYKSQKEAFNSNFTGPTLFLMKVYISFSLLKQLNSFSTSLITESWKMSGCFLIFQNLWFPVRKSCNSHQKYCTFSPRKQGLTS